jgi:hypothetical protein
MDHGVMVGMFIGGVVMMAPPVLLGVGIGVYVYRQWRAGKLRDGSPDD